MTKEERIAAMTKEYRSNPIYRRTLTEQEIEQHIASETKWILDHPSTTVTNIKERQQIITGGHREAKRNVC